MNKSSVNKICSEWDDKLEATLELPHNDPVLQIWQEHCKSCEVCSATLQSHRELQSLMAKVTFTEKADIKSIVMEKVKESQVSELSLKRMLLIGGMTSIIVGVALGYALNYTNWDMRRAQFIQPAAMYADIVEEIGTNWLTLPDAVEAVWEVTE